MSFVARPDHSPQWADDLPEGWAADWVKWSVAFASAKPTAEDIEKLPYISNEDIASWTGKLLKEDPEPADKEGRLFRRDDVLFNKLRPYLAKIYHANFDGISSGELLNLRTSERVLPRFLFHVLSSSAFIDTINAETFGTKMPRADWETVGHQPLPLPDLDTQRRIVGYLDDKTAQIDALIEKKRALLDRLAEKRQALITDAVTRGLNPNAPMKDSGIVWLGKVPEHWEVKPVKRVAKLESGHTPDKQHDEYWNGEIPWVSLNDTAAIRRGDYIDETAFSITSEGIANSSARLLPARAVVFTRDATIGEAAITTRPMAVSQHIIAWLCPEELLAPEFLLFVIYGMRGELMRITNGTTIGTIGMGDVKTIHIALPPQAEQAKIVAYVTERKARVELVMRRVEASIEKLTEYRAALVNAAVTGKIKALLTVDAPKSDRLLRAGRSAVEDRAPPMMSSWT